MILALLAGRKTQTRRACHFPLWVDPEPNSAAPHIYGSIASPKPCPYGAIGDQLWVKETYRSQTANDSQKPIDITEGDPIRYEADEHENGNPLYGWGRIRQSIFMRHWMSRLTLEITNVRVERLQDISEEDAQAEGVKEPLCRDGALYHRKCNHPSCSPATWKNGYQALWDSINAEKGPGEHGYAWAGNQWVWALTFNIIKP